MHIFNNKMNLFTVFTYSILVLSLCGMKLGNPRQLKGVSKKEKRELLEILSLANSESENNNDNSQNSKSEKGSLLKAVDSFVKNENDKMINHENKINGETEQDPVIVQQESKEKMEVEVMGTGQNESNTSNLIESIETSPDESQSEESPFVDPSDISEEQKALIKSIPLREQKGEVDEILDMAKAQEKVVGTIDIQDSKELKVPEATHDEDNKVNDSEEENKFPAEMKVLEMDKVGDMLDIDLAKQPKENHTKTIDITFKKNIKTNSVLENIKSANISLGNSKTDDTKDISIPNHSIVREHKITKKKKHHHKHSKRRMKKLIFRKMLMETIKKMSAGMKSSFETYVSNLPNNNISKTHLRNILISRLNKVVSTLKNYLLNRSFFKILKKKYKVQKKICRKKHNKHRCKKNKKRILHRLIQKVSRAQMKHLWNLEIDRNNAKKKKLLDNTSVVKKSPMVNPIWSNMYKKNRDVGAQNFWMNHMTHDLAYNKANKYYDWHNRHPSNPQINGWGRKMNMPYRPSISSARHSQIGDIDILHSFLKNKGYNLQKNNYEMKNQEYENSGDENHNLFYNEGELNQGSSSETEDEDLIYQKELKGYNWEENRKKYMMASNNYKSTPPKMQGEYSHNYNS